jgi:phosphoribosylformylglycinamidine synthase
VHIRQLLAAPDQLDAYRILVVPGGFSYGDDISSGRVLAQEMKAQLGDRMLRFVDRGGLVLGICNGFQVLVRLGLLPCTQHRLEEEVTLTHNLSNHYECRWVTLRTQRSRCVFLPAGLSLRWPAAHGEGRLVARDTAMQRLLLDEGYATALYVDAEGRPTEQYPANPNGAPLGFAGLTNKTGRVLGVMPHPDRSYLPTHMPDWRRTLLQRGSLPEDGDGMVVFREMVKVAAAEG